MTFVSPASSSTRSAEAPSPERQTPWSPEAEQAVLGAMLLDADAALKALELLDDAAFYRDAHRRLFRAMAALMEHGRVIDPVLLKDELARRGELEPAGGAEYLAVLLDVVPTAANVEHHCRIVKEKALLRRLIEAGTSEGETANEGRQEAGVLLDEAEQRMFEISFQRGTQESVRIKELMWQGVGGGEKRPRGGGTGYGSSSGV